MNKVLESLLARQTFQESRFNPRAVSPAGAKGLAQFMPGTWKDFQKASGNHALDIFNPEHSVMAQRWYMEHLDQVIASKDPNLSEEERVPWVLAAYNWGPGNVSKLFNTLRKEGKDTANVSNWLSRLPKEPKNYIKTIYLKEDPEFEKKFEVAVNNKVTEKYYDNTDFSPSLSSSTTTEDSELVIPVDLISDATKRKWALLEEKRKATAEMNARPIALSGTKQFLPINYMDIIKNNVNSVPTEKKEPEIETKVKENNEVPELFVSVFNNLEEKPTTKFIMPSFVKKFGGNLIARK